MVEDEKRIANFVAKGLRENSYAVDAAETGDDALYLADINTYDAIVLDVMIPAKNGFEVCRELREKGSQIPILMLTARDAVEDRIIGLDTGADDYLTKPFAFGELSARLRAILRRREKSLLPAEFEIGDLRIDGRGQKAERNGKTISLTAKEFAVLEYLARNANRVVGREEISEHCWDETYDPFSNSIEVFINRLRKKIDADGAKPLLHTKRGAGYLLGEVKMEEDV